MATVTIFRTKFLKEQPGLWEEALSAGKPIEVDRETFCHFYENGDVLFDRAASPMPLTLADGRVVTLAYAINHEGHTIAFWRDGEAAFAVLAN